MNKVKKIIKSVIFRNKIILSIINKVLMFNKFKVRQRNNNICEINCLLRKSNINIIGSNNKILIKKCDSGNKIDLVIYGNNNSVHIDEDVFCRDVKICVEDSDNCIHIGKGTVFAGSIQLSIMEGTKIEIGENCLFSTEIDIRTGDGHSVLDSQGTRTNASESVVIGEHVWCGKGVSILKGVEIPENCVVATKSVVTKKFMEANTILAGCPAKVIKTNSNWEFDRKC